jgi:hypothetical protein
MAIATAVKMFTRGEVLSRLGDGKLWRDPVLQQP